MTFALGTAEKLIIIERLLNSGFPGRENLWEIIKHDSAFVEIYQLFEETDLAKLLQNRDVITLMIPNDNSIRQYENLFSDPRFLWKVLSNHIFTGSWTENILAASNGIVLTAIGGATYLVKIIDGEIYLSFYQPGENPAGKLVRIRNSDIEASNGVLHILENFLI
jgi:uncharacterized surface protein with fasciclin (FAS1) repeats